jgi:hypothetical protein
MKKFQVLCKKVFRSNRIAFIKGFKQQAVHSGYRLIQTAGLLCHRHATND